MSHRVAYRERLAIRIDSVWPGADRSHHEESEGQLASFFEVASSRQQAFPADDDRITTSRTDPRTASANTAGDGEHTGTRFPECVVGS
jgi:hypothetical protein